MKKKQNEEEIGIMENFENCENVQNGNLKRNSIHFSMMLDHLQNL